MRARDELRAREPMHGDDALVERRDVGGRLDRAAESDAQIRRVGLAAVPEIETDDVLGLEPMARFLERLANHRGEERFAALEMAGGLVQYEIAARGALLDDEELAAALDDCGDRDVDTPCHRPTIFEAAGLRARFHRRSITTRTC